MMWILVLLSAFFHDFHFSRVELNYNEKDAVIEATASIFIDDLERGITGGELGKLKLGTQFESSNVDSLILDYLNTHIRISAQGQELEWKWLGKEMTDDLMAFHIHFFSPWNGQSPTLMSIDILTEIYGDQKNMVEFNHPKGRFNHLFDAQDTKKKIF